VKKTTALFEDTTMAYNRWVQGIASRQLGATKMTVSDVLDSKKPKSFDGATTKDIPIHPSLAKTPELVGSILVNLSNIESKLKDALASNMSQDPQKKLILKQLIALARHNDRMTRRMVGYFEKLS
jgi:hypothetical protein|tara:strand:+ start:117 stop:491 length:375 start_codon:yes stop_codon:yes gene_type:complete